ncbi:beta-1,3-galactosyltransferase 1 [Lepeophtheirus salmonis]|uniref:beta-1,3-galactosyltransferase 1 n=1 Tax=Lepeophtheirus salmonis TaxID=72036 RepID=UPI001AE843CE|nr:beta-1,3-galactosyltransferase 1-like [Lepeophtheirus salmonis]
MRRLMRVIACSIFCTLFLSCIILLPRLDSFSHNNPIRQGDDILLNQNISSIKYLLEPKCDTSANLTIIITSKSSNFGLRNAQRSAIPLIIGVQERIFLLALDPDVSNSSLIEESVKYGDILLGDFYEDYHRLSYKNGMGLIWVANTCRSDKEKYILKMDDDIMVRVDRLQKELPYIFEDADDKYSLAGYVQDNNKPSRSRSSKWFTDYSDSVYPDFLAGWAYVTTQKTVQLIASTIMSDKHFIFWIDDVWITGILAHKHLGLKLKSLNRFFAEYRDYIDQCCFTDMSLECMYWIGPSDRSIRAIEAFGKQCSTIKCSHESIVQKEPMKLRSCSEGACLRWSSPESSSNKMSCLSKYANPFQLPHSKGVGEVIPL